MKRGMPLSFQILLWALLNLLLLAALGWGLFRGQFGLGLDALLAGRAGDRLQSMADVLGGELARTPQSEWNAVLARSAAAYELKLMLVRPDGQRWAGEVLAIPPEVRQRLGDRPMGDRPFGERPPSEFKPGPGPRRDNGQPSNSPDGERRGIPGSPRPNIILPDNYPPPLTGSHASPPKIANGESSRLAVMPPR